MSDIVPNSPRKRQLSAEPIFYTYILYRNGLPFYIGKGKGQRIENHFDCAHKADNCRHQVCRIIRKEEREGGQISKVKIAEGIPEQAAFDLEKLFISLGAIYNWPLVNKTIGGEGTTGFKRTVMAEEKAMRKQRAIQRFSNFEEHAKLSRGATRRFSDPNEREKQSKRVLARFSDPLEREAHRQRAIERAVNAEEITPEEREIRRQRALNMWSEPGRREARSQQERERYEDPEEVEKLRQKGLDLWKDSAYLEKMAQRYSPQVREKMSKARSQGEPNRVGTFDGFVDPEGHTYTPVTNLHAFCREHDLSYTAMQLVDRDKQSAHKGWTRYNPPGRVIPVIPKKERKSIKGHTFNAKVHPGFVSPDGTVYKDIYNLKAFCKEHGLSSSKMSLVGNGTNHSHKGWTKYTPHEPTQSALL